jgi:Lipocalin-like domain
MNRRSILSVSAITVLGLAMMPVSAVSQQKSLKEQIVGTWTFVSVIETKPDGSKFDRWGPNAKGILMFDGNGRYTQFITRSDLPKFAAKSALEGLPRKIRLSWRELSPASARIPSTRPTRP